MAVYNKGQRIIRGQLISSDVRQETHSENEQDRPGPRAHIQQRLAMMRDDAAGYFIRQTSRGGVILGRRGCRHASR